MFHELNDVYYNKQIHLNYQKKKGSTCNNKQKKEIQVLKINKNKTQVNFKKIKYLLYQDIWRRLYRRSLFNF